MATSVLPPRDITSSNLTQRVADYARLSEDDAKDPDLRGENVRIQLDECELFRLSRPDWQHIRSFKDNDISASAYGNEPRPDFDALMGLVRASGVDVILCVEVTRLFRKPLEAETLIDLVWSKRTSFHTVVTTRGGYYDLRTSAGRKAVRDAVNTAAGESDNISDRVRLKKAALARRGMPNGGRHPYGFESDHITHRTSETTVMHEMARRIIGGESPRHVLSDINDRGICTAEGHLWTKGTMVNMLRRKRYVGIRTHKGVDYPAVWKPVFDPATFERLQLALRAGDQMQAQRGNPRKYLLRGFAYCGVCGSKLGGSMKRDRASQPNKPRYKCKPYDAFGRRTGCSGVSRLAEPLEDFVAETILHRFDSDAFARIFAETAEESGELEALLEEHEARKRKLTDLIADYYGENRDGLKREQFMTAKTAAEAALAKAEQAVEKLTSKQALMAGVPIGRTLREVWTTNEDLGWRRSIVALLIDRVVVLPGGGKPRYKQWRFDTERIQITWKV